VSDEQETVGSVGEEAVKLFKALQDWAQESGGDAAATGAASAFQTINEHIATGADECKFCPVCQVISAVREVSPEVKQHLSSAASSLLHAAAAAMSTDTAARRRTREPSVEKIDLNNSSDDWEDDAPEG
jgi:hypothetical protein